MRHVILALLFSCAIVHAQTITGTITGSVNDTSGLPLANAAVTVVQEATGASRSARTDERGGFVFSSLHPDQYEIKVAHPGFKMLIKQGLGLSASETLSVGVLTLEVGNVSESVTVKADVVAVQTASGEHAGLVTAAEVGQMLNMSRNVMDLLELLPGVVNNQEGTHQSMDRSFNINVQGNRNDANNFTLNGMSINAIGNNTNAVINVSQEFGGRSEGASE